MTTTSPPDLPPIGTVHSRAELLELAGSSTRRAAVLRATGGGPIVGLAVRLDRNPGAPQQIVIGESPRALVDASSLVAQPDPVPVWVGTTAGWTFMGRWVAVSVDEARSVLSLRSAADLAT